MATEPETSYTYAPGQQIAFYPEASTECIRATVETVAANLGIMWIVTEGGKRKIMHLYDRNTHPEIVDSADSGRTDAAVAGQESKAPQRPGRYTPRWPISGEATYSNYLTG